MCLWCAPQMAAYELGLLLPEDQRPLPMDLIHINDTRSDIVPNAGAMVTPSGPLICCCCVLAKLLQHVLN